MTITWAPEQPAQQWLGLLQDSFTMKYFFHFDWGIYTLLNLSISLTAYVYLETKYSSSQPTNIFMGGQGVTGMESLYLYR